MLDLRRLRLLRELQMRGTLAAVAEALAYSPSSVSQQLTPAREGGRGRAAREVRPAACSSPRRPSCSWRTRPPILDQLELAEAELAARSPHVRGTVRLAVFQSAALAIMPAGAQHPRAGSTPTCGSRSPSASRRSALFEVWARDFDLVIAEQYPGHAAPRLAELDRVELVTDALRLGGPPERFGLRHPVDRGCRSRMPWVMEPRGTASRHWAEQPCRPAGFEPDVRFETADLQAHIRLVESGNAVALLPDLVWAGRTPTVDSSTSATTRAAACSPRPAARPAIARRSSPAAPCSRGSRRRWTRASRPPRRAPRADRPVAGWHPLSR